MASDQEPPRGYFLRETFGVAKQSKSQEDELLSQLRDEWQGLSERVCPSLERPGHALVHFLQFSHQLDAWVREWGAKADAHNYQRLRQTLGEAQQSLRALLAEAKQLFESLRAQRVTEQQNLDQKRWQEEQNRLVREQHDAEHRRNMAQREAQLKQTHREIDAIYESVRQNNRMAAERQGAMWKAAHFPDSTCACGRGKIINQPCCWDCANRGRTYWY